MSLTDSYHRRLTHLRVSLTDRCNFRCVYCMPPEGIPLYPRDEILTLEEIERLVRIFVSLGVTKVRLTGGEPLLRKGIVSLVASLAKIPGGMSLSLTTNGSLLAPLAEPLRQAGLAGVNVSLDSTSRLRFHKITGQDKLYEVDLGITKALKVGLSVKINVVALSDLSREEVLSFCNLARFNDIEVRFLEFMPLCGSAWRNVSSLSLALLKRWVFEELNLISLPRHRNPAEVYQIVGGAGRIGFIASLSEPFCATCSRLRLTAAGGLRPCLFSNREFNLKKPLRDGASDEELASLIGKAVWLKPKGHEEFLGRWTYEELPKIRAIGG